MKYEDFCRRIEWFNEDEFQQFCNRFQKIMNRRYRATKAIGRGGDWSNDGIIDSSKRLAAYAIHHDTLNKDAAIANKMKSDFKKMMITHPLTSVMVFMTRTISGMGPKVQQMKAYLESDDFLKELYKEIQSHHNFQHPYEFLPKKKIEYVDCLDIFNRLMDIKNSTTWEYLLDNKITLPKIADLPNKQLDDPAYMAEWLQAGIIRFDNIEAPLPMKLQEIDKLLYNLQDKLNRDLRKYNVKTIAEVPYIPWKIKAISTPYSDTSHTFAPSFEIPQGWGDDDVIELELTPDMLLFIIQIIKLQVEYFKDEDLLFIDTFLRAYSMVESKKVEAEYVDLNDVEKERLKQNIKIRQYQWRDILTEWVAKQSKEFSY